jgi:N-acetylglutamate synthase-like GNAT family acetyltransferase
MGGLTPASYVDAVASQEFLVAEEDASVVGFGQLNQDTRQVEALYVEPGRVGRGVGTLLLQALEGAARARELGAIQLSATLNSVGFYARVGYVAQGKGVHRFRSGAVIPCMKFSKTLGP